MARYLAHRSSRNVPAWAERRAVASRITYDRQHCEQRDWVGDWLTLGAVWGLPTAVMLLALLLDPKWRAVVWVAMLAWMGAACVINARRCGRMHCRYTGPFFLGMAGLVAVYTARLRVARQSALAGAYHCDRWRQRTDLVDQRTLIRDTFRQPSFLTDDRRSVSRTGAKDDRRLGCIGRNPKRRRCRPAQLPCIGSVAGELTYSLGRI